MSGVYIHIPFCAKKCYYCDFYTSLSIIHKEKYIQAIVKELKLRQNYTESRKIETIYFGGGTPSLLKPSEIQHIIDEILKIFQIKKYAEITLEVNPDDINEQYVSKLKTTKINRISIGLQSFFDKDLKLMNRRHSVKENYKAIQILKNKGYTNISGDLIYGLPDMNTEHWKKNLSEFFKLEIPHLSAYHLTYEPNTVFSNFLKKGKIKEIKEEESVIQFELLISEAKKHNFIHYETSNFAKEGFFSKHNTSYWQQKSYLGLGASAHSYNLKSRQYNVSNLKEYIKRVGEGKDFFTKEELSTSDKYNDYIITTLRTIFGTDLSYIEENFGKKHYLFIKKQTEKLLEQKLLVTDNNKIKTSKKGKFVEDMILEKLFFVEE
ncbi:MAG: radical SAM family heme chaperone HemW [Bacteroidales bacterium]|nr:radical SAM family heme chaperone HemW [Bacteroidales bacterium]